MIEIDHCSLGFADTHQKKWKKKKKTILNSKSDQKMSIKILINHQVIFVKVFCFLSFVLYSKNKSINKQSKHKTFIKTQIL